MFDTGCFRHRCPQDALRQSYGGQAILVIHFSNPCGGGIKISTGRVAGMDPSTPPSAPSVPLRAGLLRMLAKKLAFLLFNVGLALQLIIDSRFWMLDTR